jgi:hypothetical protein
VTRRAFSYGLRTVLLDGCLTNIAIRPNVARFVTNIRRIL